MRNSLVEKHLNDLGITYNIIQGQPWMMTFSDLLKEYSINSSQVVRAVIFEDRFSTQKMIITAVGSAIDYNKIVNNFITTDHKIIQDGESYNKYLKTSLPIPQQLGIKYLCDYSIYNKGHVYIPNSDYSLCQISSEDLKKLIPEAEKKDHSSFFVNDYSNFASNDSTTDAIDSIQMKEAGKSKLQDLPNLPKVLLELVEISMDPDLDIDKFINVIEVDPKLSIQILNLSRSPFYGAHDVKDLNTAVFRIGLDAAVNFSLAAVICKSFKIQPEFQHLFTTLWTHSLYSATLMREVYRIFPLDDKSPKEAYILGLLHNIGTIILCNMFPTQFRFLCHAQHINPDASLVDIEEMIFGINHQDIGAEVVRRWQLDDDILNCVQYHHQIYNPNNNSNIHTKRMWLIDQYLAKYHIGYDNEEPITEKVFDDIKISQNDFNDLVHSFMLRRSEVDNSISTMGSD